jgi:hypothetical protein
MALAAAVAILCYALVIFVLGGGAWHEVGSPPATES